jgi:hypothetical protein
VTVTTTWGTSPTSLADRFKFAPTVTGLTPATGSSAGGSSVTVTGTGFRRGDNCNESQVWIGASVVSQLHLDDELYRRCSSTRSWES